MTEDAARRVRGSERLRTRFAAAYRGRHHPDDVLDWMIEPLAPSRRGTPPPTATIDRRAPYRPDATDEGTRAVANAVGALEQDGIDADRALAEVTESMRAGRRRTAVIAVVAVAAIAATVASIIGARLAEVDREAAALEQRIVSSDGSTAPAVFFSRFPDRIDPAWRLRPAVSGTALDGATPVTVPAGGESVGLLLVVACPAPDRSYEYTATAAAGSRAVHGYGICGSLRPVALDRPIGRGPVRILVVTRGIDPFSVSVYSRAEASP